MKKLVAIGVSALAAMFVAAVLAPSAYAYPELTCNLTVDHQVVTAGSTFTATGTAAEVEKAARAAAAGDNVTWLMTWGEQTRTGAGAVFEQTFTAPDVTSQTVIRMVAKATSAAGNCQHALNVTVVPSGAQVSPAGDEVIPNAGGPRLILLIAGVGLVVAGGFAVRQARKGSGGQPS